MDIEPSGPLAGITVIDLSTGIGGPFCAKMLADYGADVIKIEPPGGDPARRLGPFPNTTPDLERSPAFLYLNTNKRSIVLDLDQPAEREIVLSLIDGADLVVESFAPGWMAALGLAWRTLKARRPSLVLTSVTPFGQDGPYAGYKAPNLVAYAVGGQMSMTGDPDREPLKAGGYQAECQAGLNAFAASVAALFAARRDGTGEHVDVAAMECMAATLEASMPFYAYLGRITGARRGNVMSSLIGIYPCADGYLGIHAMPRNWGPLAETMGMPSLATDERFSTQRARMEHNDELVATLYGWAADQQKKDVYRRAGTMRGPVAYVHTLEDLQQSPQLQARRYFHQVDHPAAGPLTYPGNPFSMSDSPWQAGRAPLLDEHRAEVLENLRGSRQSAIGQRAGDSPMPIAFCRLPTAPLRHPHPRPDDGLGRTLRDPAAR
ncbi:MAG: CaiB/BaiF CoA transferase family protein [Dehalococcoidia bacterium]